MREPPTALLPYSGDDVERVKRLGTAHSQRTNAGDESCTKTYSFNSLGYRGPEFDPDAKHTIFVFGESHAFGVGLNYDESWPSKFVEGWAAAKSIDPGDVSMLNFAEHGASNDYIARLVLSQCAILQPDLVVVNFSVTDRVEGFADRPFKVGPWLLNKDSGNQIRAMDASELKSQLRDRIRRSQGYYVSTPRASAS